MHRVSPRLAASFASLLFAAALVAPARADTVYFVSRTEGRLYEFNSAGGPITPLVDRTRFLEPAALAIGPDGNLYIGDATNGGTISRYTLSGGNAGEVTTVVGLAGSSPPSTGISPASIAFTPDGRMLVGRNPESSFVGYPSGPVVEVVGWNGGSPTLQAFTTGGTPEYQTGLAAAPAGTLYASNTVYDIFAQPRPTLVGSVVSYDATGAFQSVVADATGGLAGPSGLVVAGTSLFTASTMNGNVYRTDLTNPDPATNTTLFASTGDFIGPLALMSDGDLLVGSVSGPAGLIYRFDPLGQLVGTFGGAEYQQIGGIVAVPEPGTLALAAVGIAVAVASGARRARRTP